MKAYFAIAALLFLTGCAMPDDDYVCTSPVVNNPNVINQRSGSAVPGMKM